jgi:WD40 repeat protein
MATVGVDDGVRLWDAATGRHLAFLPFKGGVSVSFEPGGNLLASGSLGVCRWVIPTDGPPGKLPVGSPELLPLGSQTYRMAGSEDGRAWAVIRASEDKAFLFQPGVVAVKAQLGPHPGLAYIAVSPHGDWAATGTWHATGVKVWDGQTGKLVRDLASADAAVAFSPDGRWLVMGTASEYRFHEIGTWQPACVVQRSQATLPGSLAFRRDGAICAIAHSDRIVRLIDAATGQVVATLAAPKAQMITGMCFSPDGSQLAVATADHGLQWWNLRLIRQRLGGMGLDWSTPN